MKDSFWPEVRRRMREKAIELYMTEHSRNPYFTGQMPEMEELRKGGYLSRAKVLVLRKISYGEAQPLKQRKERDLGDVLKR